MKRIVLYAALFVAVMTTSCEQKETSYNFAQIMYPGYRDAILYADQQTDSIKFATTYNWTLTCSSDWLHIKEENKSGSVPKGHYAVRRFMFDFDANTDTLSRTAVVSFNADGKSLLSVYNQYHFLNIKRPYRIGKHFIQTDSATQVSDSLMFTTYADNWSLSFREGEEPSWLHLAPEAVTTGAAGTYSVAYTLDENTDMTSRSTVLQLQSRGVVTDIEIVQTAPKEEKP